MIKKENNNMLMFSVWITDIDDPEIYYQLCTKDKHVSLKLFDREAVKVRV